MTAVPFTPALRPIRSAVRRGSPDTMRSRLADYAELCKPRIATMALVTVAVGWLFSTTV